MTDHANTIREALDANTPRGRTDLLPHDRVASDRDYVGWYPRESHTRGKAAAEFLRAMRDADWGIQFTDVRVSARSMHLHPQYHPDEGRYVECRADEPGATPVWRCELRGYGSYVTQGVAV